ncbi:proline-rich protein 4 isoform X1 [Nomascus leucogenys]|uniref:Proline rich 4 n=1 Tax=Nomascus leucogenys TaxID=61853 RepID=A0A2I3H1Q0_NOMLE|nr:proline-rich protein 4 isoform X1 [Nomascus leucogenys]
MLLVLLSVVLLALSSAQSTDNDVIYEDFTSTTPDVEDSSQSPDQGPQRPPLEGLLPRPPGNSGNQDDGPQQRPPQPGGHHHHPPPPPFQNQQRPPRRGGHHLSVPRFPPVSLEEVPPPFFQRDRPPRHPQDQPLW